MDKRKQPERMCVACRQMKPKNELIRIVRSPEGEISFDPTGKKSGRGAYICRTKECFERCRKTKQLARAFETAISDDVYDRLSEELEKS